MLKLTCGTLVGGTKYSDIYMASDIAEDDNSTTKETNSITVPTVQEIARTVACLEKKAT
jgi:hypothetical protein